jgi:hypothetical protein
MNLPGVATAISTPALSSDLCHRDQKEIIHEIMLLERKHTQNPCNQDFYLVKIILNRAQQLFPY